MTDTYILDGKMPVKATLTEWAQWFETSRDPRRVASTDKNGVRVSTVFLGVDYSYGDGPPPLFETMIFGGDHDGYEERCSTWDEAEAMHKRACSLAGIE